MSIKARRATACRAVSATLALATLTLPACGSPDNTADGPISGDIDRESARRLLPEGLAESVEGEAAAFLGRPRTAVRRELRPYLGPSPTTRVERGTTVCRPGAETASIADPESYPFACIIRASAASEGLEVEVVLGFVGIELDGACWRAANERIAATTSVPALLTRREAERPVNQIAACL